MSPQRVSSFVPVTMSDRQPVSVWRRGAPADPAAVERLTIRYPNLPSAYLAFLRAEDSSAGDLGAEPGWIQLWPAAEVYDLNESYEVSASLPGFVGFASSGGGELLAFDVRTTPSRICMVPFIPMDEADAVEIATDFTALANGFGVPAADA